MSPKGSNACTHSETEIEGEEERQRDHVRVKTILKTGNAQWDGRESGATIPLVWNLS